MCSFVRFGVPCVAIWALALARMVGADTQCADCAVEACAPTEIWVANTRGCGCKDPPRLSRCTEGGGWKKSSLAKLQKLPPGWSTCVWIHGYDNSDAEARQQGQYLLRRLSCCGPPDQGIRMVVWSWPSERTAAGPLVDLRIKAARSDAEALKLAAFMRRWQPTGRVHYAGYSFGARIITGALDDLAKNPPPYELVSATRGTIVNATLLAPAMNNCWLWPGYAHGEAVTQLDELLIVKNPIDRALKWYPFVAYGRLRTGPQALGYTGLPGIGRLGEDAIKVSQFNVAGIVGREHDVMLYLSSPRIVGRMAPLVFDSAIVAYGD